MNVLIIHASKYGFTEDCAYYLAKNIKHESTIIALDKSLDINIDRYDWVIIGSPIYMGKIKKSSKHFCQKNIEKLLKKKVALFICCTTPEQSDEYFKKGFPPQLYKNAKIKLNFGGELRQDRLNVFERKITDMVFKVEAKKQEVLYENMDALVELLNS